MNFKAAIAIVTLSLIGVAASPVLASGGVAYSFGGSAALSCQGATSALVPTAIDATHLAGVRFVQASAAHGIFQGSGNHTLLLAEDGRVFACGTNANYRTGQNVLVGSTSVATQIHYAGPIGFVKIAVGGTYGVLLGDDGWAYVFGHNASGQGGTGETDNIPMPTATSSLNIGAQSILDIAAGEYHSLFLAEDGRVFSSGWNGHGQTGLGTTSGNTLVPTAIDTTHIGLAEIVKVAAGDHHSLVLDENGVVYSFGDNANGRTGLNTTTDDTTVPTAIDPTNIGARAIVEIAAGQQHSLLLADDGTVFSFGWNLAGQTGLGTATGSTPIATAIDTTNLGGKTIVKLAAGKYFSLLLADDGSVFGFGDNTGGQNGRGLVSGSTLIATSIDTTNLGDSAVGDITAGQRHGLVVTELPEPAFARVAALLLLVWFANRSRRHGRDRLSQLC